VTSTSSKRICTQRGKYFHAFRPTEECGSGWTILLTRGFDILGFITHLSHFEIDGGKRISQHLSDFPRDNSRPTISSRAHVPLSSCQETRGYREASVGERARRGLLLLTVTLLPDSRNHSTLRR
jgi:hypothetical protein